MKLRTRIMLTTILCSVSAIFLFGYLIWVLSSKSLTDNISRYTRRECLNLTKSMETYRSYAMESEQTMVQNSILQYYFTRQADIPKDQVEYVTYSYLTDKDPEVAAAHKTGDIITSDENTIGISKSDAISICDKFLAQIGLEAQLNDITPAYRLETSENYRPYHPNRKISPDYQAYRLVYSRVLDNITIAATSSYDVPDDSMLDDHYKDWGYEHIILYVNQNGIVNLQWDYPIAIGNPLSKNMKTISCKDAEAIFEQLMPKIEEENIRKYGNDLEGRITVQISKISLEYIRVRDGKDKTTGILTPAWVFYGESVEHLRGAEEEWENKKDTPEIVMAINAVDGTIIDIVRGY